jgi:hypothetical protein
MNKTANQIASKKKKIHKNKLFDFEQQNNGRKLHKHSEQI